MKDRKRERETERQTRVKETETKRERETEKNRQTERQTQTDETQTKDTERHRQEVQSIHNTVTKSKAYPVHRAVLLRQTIVVTNEKNDDKTKPHRTSHVDFRNTHVYICLTL